MGIATVGFAHLAMTQYTDVPLNYNLLVNIIFWGFR